MRDFSPRPVLTLCACGIAASVSYGAQPPDVVVSDSSQNTAMGTNALKNLSSGGGDNTAAGFEALLANTEGSANTAAGFRSLRSNTTGGFNTASGAFALELNTTGYNNTASGGGALLFNTTGINNTASGFDALGDNGTGSQNTASGAYALADNSTGQNNTASGFESLRSNSTGGYNTASGYEALNANTSGYNNIADGANALLRNTTGSRNTATGTNGLISNTTGFGNTASGYGALYSNTIGSNNIAVGSNAGSDVTTGSNNIEIGNAGSSADHGIVRLGTPGTHLATFVAGINTSHVTGSAVYITAGGQLGVLASSERYKTAVVTMGSGSQKLTELRPVTFRLKADPKGQIQYGLIAEEVAKVYPELVIRNESGQPEGVRYEELTPMLLNEVQRQQAELGDMRQKLAKLEKLVATLSAQPR